MAYSVPNAGVDDDRHDTAPNRRHTAMRMRDKPTIAVELSIAAPPAQVWELVTDLQLMGDWSPEYQGGEWLDGATGPVVGARFKGRNKSRGREWGSVSTLVETVPGRS